MAASSASCSMATALIFRSDRPYVGRDPQALHHAGELLLRLQRNLDPAHDSWRRVRRAALWRRRLYSDLIVHTSEETRKHCIMLENCCYGYNETLILRMIHGGEFGELLYGEGAYIHDLRNELFSEAGEGLWRRTEHTLRDGNLYPSHGLGPVANYMSDQRGDRFAHIVSDRKSTRLNSSHLGISYAVFCLK